MGEINTKPAEPITPVQTTTPDTVHYEENLESQKEIDELKSQLAESQETVAARDETIAELKIKNARLISMVGAPAAKEVDKPMRTKPEVEVDGTRWKFRFGAFAFKGIHYKASDVALDDDILKEILADEGQGILKQIF